MKEKDVLALVRKIRDICPAECRVETGNIKAGETCEVIVRIPVDKVLRPIDYSRKIEKMKWDKLTIEGFRCILGSIGEKNIAEDEVSDEDLSQKILIKYFNMDDIDFTGLMMEMEKIFNVHVSNSLWYKWDDRLSSLTVQQFIDDWNNLVL